MDVMMLCRGGTARAYASPRVCQDESVRPALVEGGLGWDRLSCGECQGGAARSIVLVRISRPLTVTGTTALGSVFVL